MKLGGVGTAGRELRTLFEGGATAALTDGQLLARFSSGRGDASSEVAFAALVARHGPMVWGTCRRILRDPHAADDAFQATFLVLVKKARSVRVEDSLGRWLHGVGVRVALRARAVEARRSAVDLSIVEPSIPDAEVNLRDLRTAIDEEVERLPSSYRSVVVLCHLEGLTRELAADRLGCPVGTVNSRLSRASDLLRTRLTRRGFAPASGALAAWLAGSDGTAWASIAVPPDLVNLTASIASGVASGGASAGLVPSGAAVLWKATLRSMTMMSWMKTLALGATLLAIAAFATVKGRAAGQEGQTARGQAEAQKPEPVAEKSRPQSRTDQFKAILADWNASEKTWRDAIDAARAQGKTDAELVEISKIRNPDVRPFFRRCLELAEGDPKDPGSRDALIWIAVRCPSYQTTHGGGLLLPMAEQGRRAIELLLRHHPGDPWAIGVALYQGNPVYQDRDVLIRSLIERAEGRAAKGIATYATAQYLEKKASIVAIALRDPVQRVANTMIYDERGHLGRSEKPIKLFNDAYWDHLRTCDPEAIRRESDELYRLLIKDYADVPSQNLAFQPRADDPYRNAGAPPNPELTRQVKTLGEIAEDHFRTAVGQPAPEIEGVDLEGKPLKLADYRGKVVLLIFWVTTGEKSIGQAKEMAARLEGKPFAVLGVSGRDKPEVARKAAQDAGMTWPSWVDDGAIARRYAVDGTPRFVVIDAKGAIRWKQRATLTGLEGFIGKLIAESEPAK
jgi:RNA polymerase sigma factor (sigma-70 family)